MNCGSPCAASADHPVRRRRLPWFQGIVGVVAIARVLDKIDPDLSKAVLVATRKELAHLNCQSLDATF
jgi:hypothetical protein